MRSFILHTINKSRFFDINNASVLAADPKGLGNNFSLAYKESSNGKHLSNVTPDFEPIQLQIYFNADGTNGAANYKSFLTFLAECGISPFLLEYRDGINTKFCEVVSRSLPKSDIDADGAFTEVFTFERQSYWYEEIEQSFALKKTERDATAFPLGFPFGFVGNVFQREHKARNTFFKDAPIDITISGIIGRNIYIYIDEAETRNRVAELQLKIGCVEGMVIHIAPTPAKRITVTQNGLTESRYDITDKTKQSFLYLPYGDYIIGSNMVDSDAGKIEMSVKRYLFD